MLSMLRQLSADADSSVRAATACSLAALLSLLPDKEKLTEVVMLLWLSGFVTSTRTCLMIYAMVPRTQIVQMSRLINRKIAAAAAVAGVHRCAV